MTPVAFKVKRGAALVNSVSQRKKFPTVVCLDIDMKSKYCEVIANFSGAGEPCGVFIAPTENSLKLSSAYHKNMPTRVAFPGYEDWHVYATSSGRYTISVVLMKNKK